MVRPMAQRTRNVTRYCARSVPPEVLARWLARLPGADPLLLEALIARHGEVHLARNVARWEAQVAFAAAAGLPRARP